MCSLYLPEEIILKILLKTPVKDVIRFKTVCKHWCSLISDSNFAKTHLNLIRSSSQPTLLLAARSWDRERTDEHLSIKESNNMIRAEKLPLLNLMPAIFGKVRLKAACDGLLLVANESKELCFVCNIVTRQSTCLPPLESKFLDPSYWVLFHDNDVGKYKVFGLRMGKAAMLTSGDNEWTITSTPDLHWPNSLPLFLEKKLYWLGRASMSELNYIDEPYGLYSMDITTKKFSNTKVPVPPGCNICLSTVKGFVCVASVSKGCLDVLIFKEGAWEKHCTTSLHALTPDMLSDMKDYDCYIDMVFFKPVIDSNDIMDYMRFFAQEKGILLYKDFKSQEWKELIAIKDKKAMLKILSQSHFDSLISWHSVDSTIPNQTV